MGGNYIGLSRVAYLGLRLSQRQPYDTMAALVHRLNNVMQCILLGVSSATLLCMKWPIHSVLSNYDRLLFP